MSVVSLLNSCSSTTTCALWKLKNPLTSWKELRPSSRNGVRLGNYHSTNWINKNGFKVKAFFFNPTDDPIIKQALKVSFFSPLLSYYSFIVLENTKYNLVKQKSMLVLLCDWNLLENLLTRAKVITTEHFIS
ncbi:hypothetical protein CFP56_029390 [Quercus suber]|uniref:Uncharacterized protein n=1 Tax=Quercus suber TaxID=58331 RepID=A0AAW0LXK4_QUESU